MDIIFMFSVLDEIWPAEAKSHTTWLTEILTAALKDSYLAHTDLPNPLRTPKSRPVWPTLRIKIVRWKSEMFLPYQ